MYLPDSNVLLTRFLSPEGVGEVVDFMPIQDVSRGKATLQIVRVVQAVRGAVRFRLELIVQWRCAFFLEQSLLLPRR